MVRLSRTVALNRLVTKRGAAFRDATTSTEALIRDIRGTVAPSVACIVKFSVRERASLSRSSGILTALTAPVAGLILHTASRLPARREKEREERDKLLFLRLRR